ncbi:non-ribosomal peptide synthetase [Paenarthrobacter sp. Z7-10]|uniref:non-ribosomal peptide synthetase n=1 Tax=Paenarthrobacter sp. Z7-10 TaxID=2787635 RepID=UPI0022A95962|nr:non-ribosomal peptide synthetase [Paenarthrobacter sp. Z7-10]
MSQQASSTLPPQVPGRRELTSAQRGIWYAQQLAPKNLMYQIAQYVDIRGAVDTEVLGRAVRGAVAETDALNVRFDADGNGPYQLTATSRTRLVVTDLRSQSDRSGDKAAERAHQLMELDLGTARDVGHDQLLRTEIFRLSEDRCFFYQRVHHLMLDGYSAVLVLKRVAQLYEHLLTNDAGSDPTPDLGPEQSPFPSLDELLADESAYADSRHAAADRDYWQNNLADAEPVSGLAGRPAGTASELIRLGAHMPSGLAAGLGAAAGTAPAVLLTAVAIYLHKMTGEREVSVGLPVTARRGALAKSVPSMLSNIFPVRLRISPEKTVEETVAAMGGALRNALIHQRFRYESLNPASSYVGPSVNILPVLDDLRFGPANGTMNVLSTGPIDDLSIVIHGLNSVGSPAEPSAAEVTIQFEANAALYSRGTVSDHLQRFIRLLTELTSAPNVPVARVSLTSDEEARELLELGAADTAELPGHTVVEEFRARAAATPKARAVVAPDGELDFEELDRRSNQLAHLLRSQGAGPATSIAVRLDRSTLLPIAILAVLKSGAAYLPLDPDYPAGRVEGMLEDAAPLLLLSSTALAHPEDADSGIQTSIPVLALDSELLTSALAARPAGYPSSPSASQHDLAYIIFTSGSTGRPKAVGVEHLALLNLLIGHQQDIFAPAAGRLGRTLRVAHTAGLSFDASWDPLLWLFAGHELHLVDNQTRRDPEALMEYLLSRQIDSVETTPSFAKVLLAQGLFEASTHPSVLALGGEAVDAGLWGVLARIEGVSAYNFYGPTETTVDSMTAAIESGTGPTLGSSVLNSRHYILDAGLNPLPANAIGELYVAGVNVARGYLDKPQLSAKSFVADPFASDGSRMYRTGDVVRRLSDGTVEFLGRMDEQVKIRGFRIEPSEIEEVLLAEDGVQHAAVTVGKNRAGYDQLLAYVTAPGKLNTAALRSAARRKLPDYMVPSAIVQLAGIPLTPNGKLERKALPQPEENAPTLEPRNDAERLVAGAFTEVLGLAAVGIDDDFFELGGHSLLATRLVSVLRERHGSAPSLRTVFEFPTVAALAERLTPAESTDNPLLPQPRPERIPLSYAQRRLWFLNRFDPTSGAYNIPIVVRLNGPLAVPALQQAINDVVGRHESLRTIFPFSSDTPEQLLLSAAEARVELTAIQTTPERLGHVLRAESARGFNLGKDLPLRAILLQLNAREHVLLITLHHISSDGWSLAPLARDLSAAYNSRLGAAVPEFPPLPVQYADYTLWQRSELGNEDDPRSPISRQLEFWAAELADAPEELRLPYDYPRGSRIAGQATAKNDDDDKVGDDAEGLDIGASKSVRVDIGAQTHQRLAALGRAHNASLFMVLQAALAALLTKLGAGTDIPIGTPVAGRVDTKLDELVGFFVNTLVLRTDTSGNPSAADLIEAVRFTNLRAYANQEAPFERVVEELNPARSQDRHPLFQVMLTLQTTAPAQLALQGMTAEVDQAPEPGGAKFDLLLDLTERAPDVDSADTSGENTAAGLSGSLSFDPALFKVSTATDLARRFVAVVEHFARQPEAPLSRIPVLRPEEARLALGQAEAESHDDDNGTLLDEFAATAVRHPDAAALSDSGRNLSFGELDDRVGMLALGLAASGVEPGDRVLVALPRSIDAVASALAVLRAGAVYVPVDLSYPAERIRMIIEDSAPRLVITGTGIRNAAQDGGTEVTEIAALLEAGRAAADDPAGTSQSNDPAAARYPHVSPTDPAYIIYTSGSTGRPKGVAVAHGALANLYFQHRRTIFARTFEDRGANEKVAVAHIAGLGFDASWDPLLWLVAGAQLHMISDEVRTDAEALVRFCAEKAIDVLETTPSYVRQLINSGLLTARGEDSTRPMTIALGGEAVPDDLWQEIAASKSVIGYNFYGPTEFTVDSVIAEITGTEPNIGRPVQNVRAYVLDEYLGLAPQGIVGELYLAGMGSAMGYSGREAETASRFVADPFTSGARMYRTGDLVRRRPDGSLAFLSRADDQVKIRGFRIELGEIENALVSHQHVEHAAVVVDAAAGRIVGYYVGDVSADELRAHAAGRLPDYMVPRILLPVRDIPLTAHGKLDRRALPEPEVAGRSSRAPETGDERTICTLFGTVLGASEVGLDDDFFDLGGHSLLAVTLMAKLRGAFGVELGLRALFEAPTPAALLRAMSGKDDDAPAGVPGGSDHKAGADRDAEGEGGGAGGEGKIQRASGGALSLAEWAKSRRSGRSLRSAEPGRSRSSAPSEPAKPIPPSPLPCVSQVT